MTGSFRPRVDAHTRRRVLTLLARGDMTASDVARELGIGYTTVRTIRDETRYAGRVDQHGVTQFRRATKYYCEACEAWVVVTPCPACLARQSRR